MPALGKWQNGYILPKISVSKLLAICKICKGKTISLLLETRNSRGVIEIQKTLQRRKERGKTNLKCNSSEAVNKIRSFIKRKREQNLICKIGRARAAFLWSSAVTRNIEMREMSREMTPVFSFKSFPCPFTSALIRDSANPHPQSHSKTSKPLRIVI